MNELQNNLKIKYHKVILLVLLTITALPIFNTNVFNYSIIIMSLVSIFVLIFKSEIKINYYIIWSLAVAFVIMLSIFWSIDKNLAIGQNKQHAMIMVMYIYMMLLIQTKKDIYTVLKLFVISRIVMLLYILVLLDFDTLGLMRIGAKNLGEEWNSNAIGMNLALATFSIVVLLRNVMSKKVKILYYLILVLFFIFTLLTGSRKALFVLVFSIFSFIIMLSRKKIIINLMLFTIMSIGLYYVIVNNPFLYDVIGKRIEGLTASFTNSGRIDESTQERKYMIERGLYFFKNEPLLGYGINNYKYLLGQIAGDFRYSHNNYIELLVGIGIFGTFMYYSIFYYIIRTVFKIFNELTVFALVTAITILIIDYGLVSYNSHYINFFICVSFAAAYFSGKSKSNEISI